MRSKKIFTITSISMLLSTTTGCAIQSNTQWHFSSNSPSVCNDPAILARSLMISKASILPLLSFPTQTTGDSLSLIDAYSVAGPCIDLAQVYGVGTIMFATGASVTIYPNIKLSDGKNGEAHFAKYKAIKESDPHPNMENMYFVMATNVMQNYNETGQLVAGQYAGIWQKDGRAVVASFSRYTDGNFTKPKIIFNSVKSLRSISYFPGLDAPTGSLGLIQDDGKRINLIRLRWVHQSLASVHVK
jgi:hypothetical protein